MSVGYVLCAMYELCMGYVLCAMCYGLWAVGCGQWAKSKMVCGVWCVVCGVWCVVCGVWSMEYGVYGVCGVWCVVCGVCVPTWQYTLNHPPPPRPPRHSVPSGAPPPLSPVSELPVHPPRRSHAPCTDVGREVGRCEGGFSI
jgi:hypothetical protein